MAFQIKCTIKLNAMNQYIPTIVEVVKSNPKLSDGEKSEIINAINELEKERHITSFKLKRSDKVKRTTAILLEETIAELKEKRKAVEEHDYELQIEAALEVIRSRSLVTQKTEELKDVV